MVFLHFSQFSMILAADGETPRFNAAFSLAIISPSSPFLGERAVFGNRPPGSSGLSDAKILSKETAPYGI